MNSGEQVDDRLALFRREWPRRVSRSEILAEDPRAYRSAVLGVVLIIPAIVSSVLLSMLALEFPAPISLPAAIAGAHGLLIVVLLWLAICLWIGAFILLTTPADVRRGLALSRFAAQRGLQYARFGVLPARQGILFAGGRTPPHARPLPHQDATGDRAPLFRSEFALIRDHGSWQPSLQIAIASYTGGKNDPEALRGTFRFLQMTMPRRLPHLMIDARGNGSLRTLLPGTQRLALEGDFDRYFSVYMPAGYEQDALQLLTPDVMACLIDHGRAWDVEIVDDQLVIASRRFRARSDPAEYTAMLYFSELIGSELGVQASYYTDPRAARPRSQIAAAGARLRLRSGAWAAAAIGGAVVFMLGFPFILGAILDGRHP